MNDPPQRLLYTNTIATRPCVGRPSLSVRHEHEDNLLVVNFFLKKNSHYTTNFNTSHTADIS